MGKKLNSLRNERRIQSEMTIKQTTIKMSILPKGSPARPRLTAKRLLGRHQNRATLKLGTLSSSSENFRKDKGKPGATSTKRQYTMAKFDYLHFS
jgi:hypothetical protein